MNHAEILTLFDQELRRDVEIPGMRRDVLPYVVRFVRPLPGLSFVLYSDLDESTAGAAIDEQIAYFAEQNLTFEWKVYAHDRPYDLVDRLVGRGFEAEEQDAIMVLDLRQADIPVEHGPDVRIKRLSDPSGLEDVIRVLEPVWGADFDWVRERLGGHMAIPGYLSVYVAYAGDLPACVGWTYFYPGHFCSIWGGSTVESFRGQGLYSAVLAARVNEAKRRGVRYMTIDAGPMSKPIVARHGFEIFTYATACEWKFTANGARGEAADQATANSDSGTSTAS